MPARIFRHDAVDSTNDRAFAALADGSARDRDVHVARSQSAGRGRLGRRWESAPGEGLYLSAIHLPEPPAPPPAAITMATGLAVHGTCRALGLAAVRLDWPNDVVVGEAKLAGMLVESRGFDPTDPHFVIGIGVNVMQRSFPAHLTAERAVTSLALEGIEIEPDALRNLLIPRLEVQLEMAAARPAELGAAYLDATELADAHIAVRAGSDRYEGRLAEVDLARGLLVKTNAGDVRLDLAHVHALDRLSL